MGQTFKPPATQRVYDVCVLGPRLGGAVAGALLARRGFRVLHVDHEPAGETYEDGGYLLPTAPLLLPSPRLFPAADAALTELGLASDVSRRLEPVAPDLQVILPRHRLDLPRDPAARLAELRREWPSEADRLEDALGEIQRLFDAAAPFLGGMPPLPPSGFRERWALSKARRLAGSAESAPAPFSEPRAFQALGSHPLAESLRSLHAFLGHLDGEPSPLGLTRLLGAALRGTHRMAGGAGEMREMARRKIAESRGELLGGEAGPAVAEALELDGRRATAVRLAGSRDVYVARAFVIGGEARLLRPLLPRSGSSRFAGYLEKAERSAILLTVNLVVGASAIPPGLGEAALLVGGGPSGDPPTLLQIQPARRATRKGPADTVAGERVICAAGLIPASDGPVDDRALAERVHRLRAALADPLPFLERHLVRESVPALTGPPEARASRLSFHPRYRVQASQVLGVTGLPWQTPFANVVAAGRDVLPGLGLEGEFHAAVQAASRVMALLGRKDVLK